MSVNLSKRLNCIAGFVKPGSRVADVGTDHGYIPAWLIENNICSHVFASDIRPGPLKRAEMTARNADVHDKISFILCSGLDDYPPDSVDTIIIAGMGGETIINILTDSPWAKEKQLIIQPQSKISMLRKWLSENGYNIYEAKLVSDAGRIYLVWCVSAGEMAYSGLLDPQLAENRDELLPNYLESEIKRKMKIFRGMESASALSEDELERCRDELDELIKIREEIKKWQK